MPPTSDPASDPWGAWRHHWSEEGAGAASTQERAERLLGDMGGELESAEAVELALETADRTRGEYGRVRLSDRLAAHLGARLAVTTAELGVLVGDLSDVGADWIELRAPGRRHILALAQLLIVDGLAHSTRNPGSEGKVEGARGVRSALRGLAQGRAPVELTLRGGTSVTGTIDRGGSDFLELAEHPLGAPRRGREVRQVRSIALAALVAATY
jgi:hypothetical protein